jgi:hypothetical protein
VKAKIVPVLTFVAMCLPAFVNAFAVASGNARLFGYDTYVPQPAGPRRDDLHRRAGARAGLPGPAQPRACRCTSARPMRRIDYPLAKYAAFTAAPAWR